MKFLSILSFRLTLKLSTYLFFQQIWRLSFKKNSESFKKKDILSILKNSIVGAKNKAYVDIIYMGGAE